MIFTVASARRTKCNQSSHLWSGRSVRKEVNLVKEHFSHKTIEREGTDVQRLKKIKAGCSFFLFEASFSEHISADCKLNYRARQL